ncbi:MAG: hypothetical protein ACKV2T_38045 [Kofleriaceae bacterium]
MRSLVVLAVLAACGGDDGPAPLELTSGEPVTATIGAAGGMLALPTGEFALEIPPGALTSETEITLTPLSISGSVTAVALQPSGLTFQTPAFGVAQIPDEIGFMPILISDDATITPIEEGELLEEHLRFPIPHFSVVTGWFDESSVFSLVDVRALAVTPWSVPLQLRFAIPVSIGYQDVETPVPIRLTRDRSEAPEDYLGMRTEMARINNMTTQLSAENGFRIVPVKSTELGLIRQDTGSPVGRSLLYRCVSTDGLGAGSARMSHVHELFIDVTYEDWITPNDDKWERVPLPGGKQRVEGVHAWIKRKPLDVAPIECTAVNDLLSLLQLSSTTVQTFDDRTFSAWVGACTPLSDDSQCAVSQPHESVGTVLDPVLTLSAAAATRFGTLFPCGDTQGRKTLCAPGATFTAGDWVLVAAAMLDDVALADPTGRYQYAFVFDADGQPANNYQASAQFPKDFFAGTDKWYEALYTAQAGWTLSVRDTRIGSAQQPSNARFVIMGREIALFVPRSELGASPGFRVTAFRHEGDFGLMGGPWSGSYFPALGEPLYPAASGAPILVAD